MVEFSDFHSVRDHQGSASKINVCRNPGAQNRLPASQSAARVHTVVRKILARCPWHPKEGTIQRCFVL